MGRFTDILQRLTGSGHDDVEAVPRPPSPPPPPGSARRDPTSLSPVAETFSELAKGSRPPLRGRERAFAKAMGLRVQEGRLVLPVLPPGMVEALAALDDPDVNAEAIEKALRLNPELAGEIVRTANSVWFGGRSTVQDLRVAVLRLGLRNLRNVLLGVALKMSLSPVGRTGEMAQRIWGHSVECSSVAGQLAVRLGADRERLFLGGLLHDLGKVSVLTTAAEVLSQERRFTPRRELIEDLLHRHHERAGSQTARRWRLGEEIVACAAHHHSPEDAGPHRRLAAIVYLANRICHSLERPVAESPAELAHSPGGLILELSPQSAAELLQESETLLADQQV